MWFIACWLFLDFFEEPEENKIIIIVKWKVKSRLRSLREGKPDSFNGFGIEIIELLW